MTPLPSAADAGSEGQEIGAADASGTVPGSPPSVADAVNAGNGSNVFVFTKKPTATSVSPRSATQGDGPPERHRGQDHETERGGL